MQGKRKAEQLYGHMVVSREVDDRRFAGAGASHGHLRRLELNLVVLGAAADGDAEILIRVLRSQPDSAWDLRREVRIS